MIGGLETSFRNFFFFTYNFEFSDMGTADALRLLADKIYVKNTQQTQIVLLSHTFCPFTDRFYSLEL